MEINLVRASLWLVLLTLGASISAGQQWTVIDPPNQDVVSLPSGSTGAAELSGITWAGGSQFYVVDDNTHRLFPVSIVIDATSGLITSATLQTGLVLSTGVDLEGVAFNSTNNSVYVSDESGPALREHSLADGSLLQTLSLPTVFNSIRSNLSLESLSREPGGAALWTANEEALSVDGPVSSVAVGTTIRLQKFDAGLSPSGQWAYVTDSIGADILSPGRDVEVSGVSDLVALPGGGLLVLERQLGTGPFRHRLYEVDFSAATDVSAIPALNGASFTPVAKTLLWEHSGAVNFEGISLGPALPNQAQSLVLVSDDGGGLDQYLYALALLPSSPVCEAQPLSGCRPALGSSLALASRGGTQDKVSWAWRKGTLADLSPFGDPTTAIGLGFGLCVYDSVSGVGQLRVAAGIARGALWRAAGSSGFKYADRAGSPDGITKVKYRSGTGKAEVKVSGKGAALGVPAPPLSGNLLRRDPEVVVQFVNRDQPSQCFTASYPNARRESSSLFKARL